MVKIRSDWVSGRSLRRREYAIALGIMGGVSASLRGGVVPEMAEKGPAAEEAGPLDGLPAARHQT